MQPPKKRPRRWKFVLSAILLIILLLLGYVKFLLPNVGAASQLSIQSTPERLARGKYLAQNVCNCVDCHSTRDHHFFAGPITEGTLGKGGDVFDHSVGFPGVFYAKNITPSGIARYTDGELYRVITTGVTKEGKALFPVMPYPYYGKMDTEDINSLIVYIRSLPSIEHDVPAAQFDFPMNFIVNTIPVKAAPQKRPDGHDSLAYGAYLTNACACMECHTPASKGRINQALAFSGGRAFSLGDGTVVRSSNLTADPVTGIGSWTEDMFVKRFTAYANQTSRVPVTPGQFNTVMPWYTYGKMTDGDLASIFQYLKTIKGISNAVNKFSKSKS